MRVRSRPALSVPSARRPCKVSCQKVRDQMARTRATILAESAPSLGTDAHLLRLAVNEAESLAWQTQYPHLLFPALAAEKVQAVAAWGRRQQRIRTAAPILTLAS